MATVSAPEAAGTTQRRRSRGVPERRLAWFMVSPSLVLIALVAFYPIAYGVWVSLHQYSLLEAGLTRWAQPNPPFGNYTRALWGDGSTEFWDATRVTFIFTIISVALELVIGVAMAMAMHSAFKGQGILRTVVLVPWAILTVVTAITWQTIFEPSLGFVNSLLGAVGLPDDTVWLGQSPEALMVMIFDLPFVLTKGAHGTTTLSLISYETFQTNRILGLGSALAVLTFLIVMIVSFVYIRFVGGNIRGLAED